MEIHAHLRKAVEYPLLVPPNQLCVVQCIHVFLAGEYVFFLGPLNMMAKELPAAKVISLAHGPGDSCLSMAKYDALFKTCAPNTSSQIVFVTSRWECPFEKGADCVFRWTRTARHACWIRLNHGVKFECASHNTVVA